MNVLGDNSVSSVHLVMLTVSNSELSRNVSGLMVRLSLQPVMEKCFSFFKFVKPEIREKCHGKKIQKISFSRFFREIESAKNLTLHLYECFREIKMQKMKIS